MATIANQTRTSHLFLAGVVGIAAASVATAAVAAVGHAAGISLDVSGAPIPILGFSTTTAMFSFVGLVLAAVLARTVRRARQVFVRTTVVLTALSWIPDLLADAAPATKALLMFTHLVAAAIVIPTIARRLPA
ncbi:DUF6069 family protein [Paractinoplanes globisporus]|uniref:DUF6069 family protein n=1 Tax=Paractinoplanes globisporus TaxID=113565 RepID=A0ABW6WKI4_9ACTN|nr:DUF6069 family protein [Actinoplanes globisporus]